MDNRIDSIPCADDHSSPRSPRHVLAIVSSNLKFLTQLYYPRIDLTVLAHEYSEEVLSDYLQTDFPVAVDIGVEATTSPVCGDTDYTRRSGRIFCHQR